MMSADRYKVYFSGFPKDTCRWIDLYNLFSRVVQIKHLWISFRKGHGCITLYSESSVKFILQKDIQLVVNGSYLKLARFTRKQGNGGLTQNQSLRKLQIPKVESDQRGMKKDVLITEMQSTYQSYKDGISGFWEDVPHENTSMVTKKKKRKWRNAKDYTRTIQTCKNLQKKTLKRKKKNKRKVKASHINQAAVELCRDYSLMHSKLKDNEQCTGVQRDLSCDKHFKDDCTIDSNKKHQEHVKDTVEIKASSSCLTNVVNRPDRSHIPLYVKIGQNIHLIDHDGYNYKNICDFVHKEEGIPPELQLLIYQGKLLKEEWYTGVIEPYTTVEVLVKGKGGMMEAGAKADAFPQTITEESTEENVLGWLGHVVKIPENVLSQYPDIKHLDGLTLLSYKNNFLDLKHDIEVPIGLARKILLSLDQEFCKKWQACEMYPWSIQQLMKFIKESVGDNEDSALIEVSMREHMIDSMAFYSYTDSKELKKELDIANLRGVIFQRLIAKRNKFLEKSCIKTTTEPEEVSVELASTSQTKEEKEIPIHNQFLNDGLGLIESENLNELTDCKLFIIYSSWTKANELENKFLFFVLCNQDDFVNKESKTFLWNQIRKNVKLWLDELHPKDKNMFTLADNSDDTVIYQGNKLTFSQKNVSSRCFMDKDISKILCYKSHNLLISSKLLISKNVFYQCILSEHKKPKCTYCFSFDENKEYWFFNPDDFADGFQKRRLADFRIECNQTRGGTDNSSETGEASYFCQSAEVQDTNIKEFESPRPFREEATHILYHENRILTIPESDGTLSDRCFEFKYFASSLKSGGNITKFVRETLRFSCGVLNARRNGTIFFGVADNVHPIEGKVFNHGEIVGFPIREEKNDCKTDYTDALRQGIDKCFNKEGCSAASNCIRNPVFVTVLTKDKQVPKFVMEVDICPLSNFCENISFRVNLNKFGEASKKFENEYLLFHRKGSATTKLTGNDELLFLGTEFKKIVKARQEEEQSSSVNKNTCRELPIYKLEKLFCGGLDKFNVDMWPIFVFSKPSDDQKLRKSFFRNLTFLRKIKSIVAVFDFDEKSNEDGLSCNMRNKNESELYDEAVFKQYSGEFDALKSHLGIPQEEKTIWIFSNGRSDTLEPKLHLQQTEWRMKYRSGISDAISFFSQPYVIPKGRAVFIFLLFTSELEGVIDTFIDVLGRFSLDQVIVLAEKKSVYDAFKTSVIGAGGIDRDLLDDQSISGVSWEQVNSSLKCFLGEEDKGNCMLATSSGIVMPTEERFLESLSDLTVLSATQCENKVFEPDKKKQFSQEEEFKFYRGSKVSWWNFYFETHVLKRHKFESLKDKVQNVLQCPIQDQRVVVTITLVHEPGAGGSTLANHILWEFRKNYKCCIIKKITERTHIQLLQLWEFKEPNTDQANPLLILIDELTDTECWYENLVSKIHTEFRKRSCPNKPFCCIVLCHMEERLQDIPRGITEILSERLYQKLNDKEQEWLEAKFKELENTRTDSGISGFKPEYLLSFMILRTGFNREYVRRTIKALLQIIQKFPNEFTLLKYTSLVSCYVSSKHNGPKVYIPLDCCDELMGAQLRRFKRGWYEELSSTIKILLIVEEREHKNGSQIRMAHPVLAKEVFTQIRELVGVTISEIASEFLESSLLKFNTYGRTVLEDITKEMLNRRKKLDNRDQLTYFSPLIADILKEEDGHLDKAIEILIKGFEIFNSDHVIAQTIARLYARNKQFDPAAKWAKDAVMLASKSGKSYCIHTLGYVLKEKFLSTTSRLGKVEPRNAQKYLQLAIEALENFLEAQMGRVSFTSLRVLYPFNDTINIINMITKFLTKNVKFSSDFDLKHYLCDPDFVPEELSDIWKDLHEQLKSLQKYGLEAFDTLEQYVCFNTVFSSQSNEEDGVRNRSAHSSYKSMQMQYPLMFTTFSDFFGETELDEPESFPTEDSKNQWHRRKVLHLKGNSFMNIFQIFYDIKKRKLNKPDALGRLKNIHCHLSRITKRDSRDLCNLVCVNFALGLLDGKRESDETLYRYCTIIIGNNTYGVSLAHFFMMILLWPTSRMKLTYNDDIFQKSLKALHNDNLQKYKGRQSKSRFSPFVDEDYIICQVTPQLFLTKEEGFKSVCSRYEILFREQQASFFDNALWEKKLIKQKLKKLKGQVHFTQGCSNSYILLQNENSDKPIAIRKLRTGKRNILSQEEVTFYLGFSMAGPVAYNIKPVKHNIVEEDDAFYYNPERDFRAWYEVDSLADYLEKSIEELQKLIGKIGAIKEKDWTSLSQQENLLIEDEDDIRIAINIKEGKDLM